MPKLRKFSKLFVLKKSRATHILTMLGGMLVCGFSFGQAKKQYARIDLHKGPSIEGEVIQLAYQEYVKLLIPTSDTLQNDTLTIPWADIAEINFITAEVNKLAKEEMRKKANKPVLPTDDRAWYFMTDFGAPIGADSWGYPVMGPCVQFGVGKGFDYRHHLALTIGYDLYLWPEFGFAPIGVEYYGRKSPKSNSWFYFVETGFGIPLHSEYDWRDNSSKKGGMYFNPGIGYTSKKKENRSWYLKFGLKYQNASGKYDGFVQDFTRTSTARIEESVLYQRFDMRLGYRFF